VRVGAEGANYEAEELRQIGSTDLFRRSGVAPEFTITISESHVVEVEMVLVNEAGGVRLHGD
jgi:hypothetical protein